ncbi:polyprenyl synthetase family protein, partial [Streptomyces kronopolitis]
MHADTVQPLESSVDLAHRNASRAAGLVTPALRATVDTFDNRIRPIVAYHFGWMDTSGRPTANSGGKMIRAALTILAAEACGGDAQQAVPGAAAVELVHNFSLLH